MFQKSIRQKIKQKGMKVKYGFSSKALSKYVLQNVMEFLDWRTDIKVRMICKKMREAWDMHLLNLSFMIQV